MMWNGCFQISYCIRPRSVDTLFLGMLHSCAGLMTSRAGLDDLAHGLVNDLLRSW